MSAAFEFYTAAKIVFGDGALSRLEQIGAELGSRALLVLGGASADRGGLTARLSRLLPVAATARCPAEPTIEAVDRAVAAAREHGCDFVVAAGGGSVLDCGKAAAGMISNPGSLLDYLEGVGAGRQIERAAAPLVAVPTTAGTGSEVTKNAVISGPGYKKSVRSPLLIPQVALVDPDLTYSMPPALTAACGMDALTQLIESYLSRNAGPLTDALALDGIGRAARSLQRAFRHGDDAEARREMSLASLLGGICLANAGLGAVHGFASPLGARLPIPHGVACAALLPQVLEANVAAARGTSAEPRLRERLCRVATLLVGPSAGDETKTIAAGIDQLRRLQRELQIPGLASFGLDDPELQRTVVAESRGSSMRYNPVQLTDEQLERALLAAC